MKNDGRAVIAVIEERGLFIERTLSYRPPHMPCGHCLVDDQCLHDIMRLVFVFSHAERKLVEGSLNEECTSTAANQGLPQNVPRALLHQTQQQHRQ